MYVNIAIVYRHLQLFRDMKNKQIKLSLKLVFFFLKLTVKKIKQKASVKFWISSPSQINMTKRVLLKRVRNFDIILNHYTYCDVIF